MSTKPNTTDYLVRDMPSDLHRRAKVRAALENLAIRDLILEGLAIVLDQYDKKSSENTPPPSK